MGDIRTFLRENKGYWRWAAIVFFFAALVPEYVLPVLCLVAFFRTIRRHAVALHGTEKAILIYIAWMIVAVSYSSAKVTALTILGMWGLFFFGSRMMLSCVDTAEKLDFMFLCAAGSGGVCGAIAVMQMVLFHLGGPLKKMFNPFWHPLDTCIAKGFMHLLPQSLAHLMPRTQFIAIADRASGPFTNPLFLAVFLCMMIPFCTYCLFYFPTKGKKIFAALCLLLCAGGIAVSYSRGPYLAACIVFLTLLLYGKKHAWKLLCAGGGLLVCLAVVAGGVFRRLLTLFDGKDISVNTRSEIWKACLQMLRGHWLFGYGTGVGNVRDRLHETYGIMQPHAHNLFLQIMLENGVIGLALFLTVLGIFVYDLFCLFKKGGKCRGMAVSLFGSLVGLCGCGMTDYVFYGMKPMCYLLMCIGLAACARRVYDRDPVTQIEETKSTQADPKETAAIR